MPRSSPLPDVEAGICSRLLEFRTALGLKRPAFAAKAGIDSAAVVGYESQRSPVRYAVAWKILNRFQLNPRWLWTGEGSVSLDFPFPSGEELGVSERALFSEVYSQHLRVLSVAVEAGIKGPDHRTVMDFFVRPDVAGRAFAERHLRSVIERWVEEVPDSEFNVFVASLVDEGLMAARRGTPDPPGVIKKRRMELQVERSLFSLLSMKRLADSAGLAGSELTLNSEKRNSQPVIPTLSQLLQRVRVATAGRGSKARLAECLKVPPSRVSEWLSGKAEPSGDTALRLLAWLAEQEKDEGLKTPRNPPS